MFKFGPPRLQVSWLQWVENNSSGHFLDRGNIAPPKSESKVEMVEVEAKKPDDVVDVENRFRAKLVAQLVVDEQEHNVKHCEDVPPEHGGVGHLRSYLTKLVNWRNTFLVADRISGVFSDARESRVRTLAKQILLDLP